MNYKQYCVLIVQSAEFKKARILKALIIKYILMRILEVPRGIIER